MPKGSCMTRPVLFAFSGPRASKKEDIFCETKRLHRERHPEQPLAFVEAVSKKPHPLDWPPEHRTKHPTTRLVEGFAEFNERGIRVIRPTLAAGKVLATLRYGLDVFLDALADADCPQARKETFDLWHNHLVPARVVRGTPKPQYLIAAKLRPAGGNVETFYCRQERDILEYFEGTGQNPPIFLRGDTVRECAEEALGYLLVAAERNLQNACA